MESTLQPKTVSRVATRPAPAAPRLPQRPIAVVAVGGLRLFRTREGRIIELPDDMTVAEAAQLEADAIQAEQQLGKGPPPQPVPDVKKLPPKEVKKEKAKPRPRGRREDAGKGPPKPSLAAAVALLAVGPGKAAQYLAAKGAPILAKGIGVLRRLRQSEQTHDTATDKRAQSEQAVVIPVSEGQAKSNDSQVDLAEARPAPPVDEKVAKAELDQTLAANVPRTLEGVDNFQRDAKAQHMGADVMRVVQGDKQAVISTFNDTTQTPAPAPPEHTPVDLPPEEPAPGTPVMNLGQGAIAPLEPQLTDVSSYTKEADAKLVEEGVTQEQLDMADSGELAEANKEKKGMAVRAKSEPLALQEFARQEGTRIATDLALDEKTERAALRAKRKSSLGATKAKQKSAKTALEKKRDEVAGKINGIYQAAQDRVKLKLAALENESMKRFDDGNTLATKTFEDTVNREFAAFKADRYSGWFGWARKAKDWLLGMDDLPGVKAIFERNRAVFVKTINTLVESITAANKRVIRECKVELTNARKAIKEYVATLRPGLAKIGQQAAAEMDAKLDDLDQMVVQKEEELKNKLKDKQTAAIKAIDQKIEKMKEAMAGALAKLGKLLLWAAKKFFTWALAKFGVSLSTIESIIDKGVAVLKAIFTGPIKFVKNLVRAAGLGFENFGTNFLTHLKNAVFEWLTGALEGVILPATWNLKGIASVVLQMVGITYQNIRARMIKQIPEPVVKTLEASFSIVQTLITEGPMAAWEELKNFASEMTEAFVDSVKNWIQWSVVKEAIKTILAMFIPGAGIVRAIIAIYDTIVFFIQKAKQIIQMIGNFLGSIAEIAAGNIGAAAAALEEGLARGLKLVIAFLARFLRLEGITGHIRKAIQSVRSKVDAVIDKLVGWVVNMAKKAGRFVATKAGEVFSWAFAKAGFSTPDGKGHSIYIEGDEQPRLMIATSPKDAEEFLKWWLGEQGAGFKVKPKNKTKIAAVGKAIGKAKEIAAEIARLKRTGAAWRERQRDMLEANVALSQALSDLVGKDPDIAKEVEKYKLEGLTGTYGSMPKPTGDDFTADHQPQAAILVAAAKFRYFGKSGELVQRAEGRAKEGYAINLYKKRHEAGRTYGAKGKETKDDFLDRVKPLVKDKPADAQRQAVIDLIKKELRSDVAAIKRVVRPKYDAPIWKDVMKVGNEDGPALVGEVRTRILAGEDQIANQDIDSLAS